MPAQSPLTLARRALLLSVAVAAVSPAASDTWNPAIGDGSWNDLSNWTTATTVPGPDDTAIFNTVNGTTPTTPHTVTVPTPVTVADLTIQRTGMTLDVPVGSSLTVTRPGGGGSRFVNYGLNLDGATINAGGTVTAGYVRFAAGRVNGTLQFAEGTGTLLLTGNTAATGGFQFNGRGQVSGGAIVAGLNLTTRQTNAATPGELKLYATAAASNSADINNGTITLDASASLTNSSVSIVTTLDPQQSVVINNGMINLNAGSAGTNTRTIVGGLSNSSPGTVNVAGGVNAIVTKTFLNAGKLNVASGGSLTVGNYSTSPSGSVARVDGVLNTPNFTYAGSSTVSGTVNLIGSPVNPLGNPTNGPRTATIRNSNPTTDGTFIFHGGGELAGPDSGSDRVPRRITVVGQPIAAAPTAELRLTTFAYNDGTITLAGNNVANSAVTLVMERSGRPIDDYTLLYSRLSNYGTLNLNAGGTGTNTRTVIGTVSNDLTGSLTVASGVTASITKELSNNGRVTVAGGGLLSVPIFSQNSSTGVNAATTIDGTLTAGGPAFTALAVRNQLRAGRSSGFTAGPLRTTTATAARGLGYGVAGGLVTIKPALYGDADLDGGVSINDFNALAANFGQASGKVWVNGDFDYDGGVSINDFNSLAANFGQSLTGPAAAVDYAGLLSFAAAYGDLVAFEAVTGVPEPTAVAAVGAAAGLLVSRRRRLT